MGLDELKPDEMVLLNLIQDYKTTSEHLSMACKALDEEIQRIQAMRDEVAKPFADKLSELELQITPPMLDRKASFECSYGKISYRKGAVRRTWNLDALDQICSAKLEVKNEIWAFRKESVGEPTISIKIEGVK